MRKSRFPIIISQKRYNLHDTTKSKRISNTTWGAYNTIYYALKLLFIMLWKRNIFSHWLLITHVGRRLQYTSKNYSKKSRRHTTYKPTPRLNAYNYDILILP